MDNKQKKLKPGVGVSKKENESVGSLSRRFFQKVRKSGVLVEARKRQYKRQNKNRRAMRASALVREQRKKEYNKLRKWGKVK